MPVSDEAFAALADLGQAGADLGLPVDPTTLLEGDPVGDPEDAFEGRDLPGEGDPLDLSVEDKKELARQLCEELNLYDSAMRSRISRWDEIEDFYDLVPGEQGGEVSESETIVSEWLMSQVDQATARLEEAILGAEPLVRTRPLRGGAGPETKTWAEDAERTEAVLNNYVRRESGFDRILPIACHRTTKLGTTVFRIGWRRKKWVSRWYNNEGKESEAVQESGDLNFEVVENRQVVFWPPNLVNWQDAELMGHRAVYSHWKWRQKAADLGLDAEAINRIEASGGEDAIEPATGGMPATLNPNLPPQQITELWCDRPLPGQSENTRFQIFLHEKSQEILKVLPNRHREQQHPYFPMRYKLPDKSGWGDGLGDEALTAQSIESGLRTLEMDNLMAGAYWVNWVKAGSLTDINLDRLRPGEVLRGDDPEEFKSSRVGGDAPEVGRAIDKNRYYGREATGMASVLGGQGDPTMKSGAGTGSTLALIEQASTKFNAVGRRIKYDLADIFNFALELLAQFATKGQLYKVATKEDAGAIEMLRWMPPRARIRDIFHVEVEAPSASTSNEARKQGYLMLWSFASQFVQMIVGQAGPLLQQENPEGYARWLREWADFLIVLARRIVEYHDLPGLKELIPDLPETTPQDVKIIQLTQQVGQLEGQLQQIQMAMQGGGPMGAPPAPAGPGGPPMGQPPAPPMGPQGIVGGGYGG